MIDTDLDKILADYLHYMTSYALSVSGTDKVRAKEYTDEAKVAINQLLLKARRDELKSFQEYSYDVGFRGTGMEHLEGRIQALDNQIKEGES